VNNVKELLSIVGQTEINKKVKVALIRDKKEITLDLVTGLRPQEEELQKSAEEGAQPPQAVDASWRGVKVEAVNPQFMRKYNLTDKSGVVVVYIDQESPAADSGIIPGDVIFEINKQKIATVADFDKVTRSIKGDALVQLSRGYVVIKEKREN
jgi:S1-C subfamily serine protease